MLEEWLKRRLGWFDTILVGSVGQGKAEKV